MKHTNLFLKGASVSVVALWFLSAEPTFTVTPTEGTDLVKKSKIWISGDATVATTFPKTKNEDSFSGRILYLTGTTPDSGEFTARYEFEVKTNGKFRFFSALTRQGTTYASPVQFRFDQQVFRDVKPNAERVSAWGISKAINWEYLDDLELQSGKHSIEFKTSRKAQNGNWSFMCDGIIGIDTEEQIKGLGPLQVPDQVKPGAELDVVFSSERELFLDIGLLHGPVVVIRKQHRVTIGENKVKLNLPKYMGHGAYRIILSQLGMSEVAISQRSIEVGKPPLANAAAKIESVSVSGTVCSIRLSDDSSALGTRVVGMVFVDGKVYGAQVFEFYKSRILDVPLTSDLVKVVAGRQAEMVFYGCPQVLGNEKKVALSVPGEATPLRKPMNYGVFVDSSKLAHAWYMDHGSRYIYDGVPYIPWGGMWCPNTLFLDQWDDVSIEKALAHDRKTIEALKAKGVVDVYFNQATRAPTWIRQYFVDLMELEGFRYGYQLNGASASSIPSFFITRDQIGLSGWKGLVRGTIEGGKITARFPKSYKILGILAVEDTPVPTWSRFFSFIDQDGKTAERLVIDLETAQDFKDERVVSFGTDLPATGPVILIPMIEAKMHHADFWDPEVRRKTQDRISWISQMRWGPNLRSFIEMSVNETHMLNTTENLRQFTPWINKAFSDWLSARYTQLDDLERAWGFKVLSFEIAGRLVPLRREDKLLFIDPEKGSIVEAPLNKTQAWLDYNDMIRETHASHLDELAIQIKSLVNIPVVHKTVNANGQRDQLSRKYLGWDGVGFEIYGGKPLEAAGGAAVAQTHASSHTMWQVATELGHNAAIGNGGVKFFRDFEEMQGLVTDLASGGVSGFYFFGLDLKPLNLWSNHNFHNFPEGIQWVDDAKKKFPANPTIQSKNYTFPAGYTWWWWTTRNKAVYGREQNPLPLSVLMPDNEWYCSTDILPDEFDRVLVSCPYPPFSIRHAPVINGLVRDQKKMIYFGTREDLGGIEALDVHFSSEKVSLGESETFQVLKKRKDVRVLAEEQGKPWAIRAGNLVIVTRIPKDQNKDKTGVEIIKKEWLP